MSKSAKDNKILKICLVLLTAGCIVFILSNSLKPASVSGPDSQSIADNINGFFKSVNIDIVLTNHILRKTAHFAEFFLLGVLTACTFGTFTKTLWKHIFNILFVGLGTAVADETVQLFVDGRGSQVSDVLLDFAGAFAGTAAVVLIFAAAAKHRKKKEKNRGKHVKDHVAA